ncbi:Cyclic di-GMP phosphodiesterase response regulator RpfG [Paraconexibacter sp. AEG42_29]|uniref:Cyclic di-GMP phosphodiesterase response regulator RpfG n=1 Tax=Paraconexibacter sp. AEG42_29 TaxID=2997339 RepID=A0AAU7AQ86_9ACTN
MGHVGADSRDAELAELRAELDRQHKLAAEKERQLERYAADLRETFKQERARAQQLRASYVATVRALANAVEARDAYTGKHAERVAAYGLAIARQAGLKLADDPQVEFGFLLHDIGKVAVADAILFKPEPLSPGERSLMELHPVVGWEILRDVDFLGEAKDVVRSHHERWDGRGYPDGLAGEDIPPAARVFAVADTLDALTSDRPYRPGRSFDEARVIIAEGDGSQFDPVAAAAFAALPNSTLEAIAEAHQ